MSYKVVRDLHGGLVCFGPNDENYGPSVKEGHRLSIEENAPDHTHAGQLTIQRAGVSVTMRQARLALLSVGELAKIAPAIQALPSPQKEQAEIEWEYATTVDRSNPLMSLLGLPDEEIDRLFDLAKNF